MLLGAREHGAVAHAPVEDLRGRHARPQPFVQRILAERACFEVAVDEGDHLVRLRFQPCAVQGQEDVEAGEGNALVAVDEAVVIARLSQSAAACSMRSA